MYEKICIIYNIHTKRSTCSRVALEWLTVKLENKIHFGTGDVTIANIFPWFGERSSDVKSVDVNFGAAPVDWTVCICQTPIKRGASAVLDSKVGEGENTIASL